MSNALVWGNGGAQERQKLRVLMGSKVTTTRCEIVVLMHCMASARREDEHDEAEPEDERFHLRIRPMGVQLILLGNGDSKHGNIEKLYRSLLRR